jgi:hypothetical protein
MRMDVNAVICIIRNRISIIEISITFKYPHLRYVLLTISTRLLTAVIIRYPYIR